MTDTSQSPGLFTQLLPLLAQRQYSSRSRRSRKATAFRSTSVLVSLRTGRTRH